MKINQKRRSPEKSQIADLRFFEDPRFHKSCFARYKIGTVSAGIRRIRAELKQ